MDQCCRPACPRPPALPPPSNDDGAKNASRYHFCAACLPIELKSLLTNGLLDSVFARFDDNTKNRSCDEFAPSPLPRTWSRFAQI